METKRVLSIIFSILFIGAFAFVLSWGIINFNKVQDGLSGTGVYTKEDVDNAYKDGYSTALKNEKEYSELIDSYRDTITAQTDQISQLNSQVALLTNNNRDYANQILNLNEQKNSLEEQVENLSVIKISNQNTINDLNSQILILQKEVSDLQNSNFNYAQEIAQKNSQISNLQNSVNQLQKTNELNIHTINSLNNQITILNSQISEMSLQIQNNSNNVTSLNNKISELEKSIAYYEQYISNLENGEQVVATFEFDGSVYNIQIVNANSTLSVTTPNSTDYVVFNFWTINGEQIDLSTYRITQNIKIIADVTYNYDVNFMIENSLYDNQIITKNGFATLPINPIKVGYEFDGWTINGVDIIDPTSIQINSKTIFIAKFTKLHTVNFVYEDSIISTQSIRNGNFASNISIDNTVYKKFNGWTVNGTIINLDSYKIVADTTLIADIIYSYDVQFLVNGEIFDSQIIRNNEYASIPISTPVLSGFKFLGWSLNGIDLVDISSFSITNNTQFIAIFIEQVGFDSNVYSYAYSGSYGMQDLYSAKYNNYSIGYYDKKLYFLDTNTNVVESYNFVQIKDIYVYGNYVYANDYSKPTLYRFNILDKTYETVYTYSQHTVRSKSTSSNDVITYIYNDIVYIFGYKSTSTSSSVAYTTYNLNTKSFSTQVDVSSTSGLTCPYQSYQICLFNNNLYFTISNSSSKTYYVFCLNTTNNSYTLSNKLDFNITSYVYDVFTDNKNVYVLTKNGIFRYNISENNFVITDCPYYSAGSTYFYCLNDVLFVRHYNSGTYELYIYNFDTNKSIQLSDSPFTSVLVVSHISDNMYIIYGKVGSAHKYTYYWLAD